MFLLKYLTWFSKQTGSQDSKHCISSSKCTSLNVGISNYLSFADIQKGAIIINEWMNDSSRRRRRRRTLGYNKEVLIGVVVTWDKVRFTRFSPKSLKLLRL